MIWHYNIQRNFTIWIIFGDALQVFIHIFSNFRKNHFSIRYLTKIMSHLSCANGHKICSSTVIMPRKTCRRDTEFILKFFCLHKKTRKEQQPLWGESPCYIALIFQWVKINNIYELQTHDCELKTLNFKILNLFVLPLLAPQIKQREKKQLPPINMLGSPRPSNGKTKRNDNKP